MSEKRKIEAQETYELECDECGNLYGVTGDELIDSLTSPFSLENNLEYEDAMDMISADIDFHVDHCPQCSETEFEVQRATFKTKA